MLSNPTQGYPARLGNSWDVCELDFKVVMLVMLQNEWDGSGVTLIYDYEFLESWWNCFSTIPGFQGLYIHVVTELKTRIGLRQ